MGRVNDSLNFPFSEVAEGAKQQVEAGNTVFQKWTCEQCLTRQTMDVESKFSTHGQCQECGHVTDIRETGCNYTLIATGNGETLQGLLDRVIKRKQP